MEKTNHKGFLRSGELARLASISPDTLRHYERLGVLPKPQRSSSNYRMYPPSAVDRVRLVRRALAVGFSLSELAKILKVRENGGAPCKQVKALLENKLESLDLEIAELKVFRKSIGDLLDDWQHRLAAVAPGEPARLLENIPSLSTLKGSTNDQNTRTGFRPGLRGGRARPLASGHGKTR